jgi:hypothetical protein
VSDGAALLDLLATLDLDDALAVNAFNWRAFLYVRPLDASSSGRYLHVKRPGEDVLLPRAPDMHLLPDLATRIMVEAMERGEAL